MVDDETATQTRLFELKVRQVLDAWKRVGIDRRGLDSARRWDGGVVDGVSAYVGTPGSRARFDEAMERKGEEAAVEYWIVHSDFRDLFESPVLRRAQRRIDGDADTKG